MSPGTGVVIPAYRPDVDVLCEYIDTLRAVIDPETILVAVDDPQAGVTETLSEYGVELETSPTRRGKGAAISSGFDALETEWLAFADADGSTPADSVDRVIAALERADLAVGSRRHPDAVVETHQSHVRRRLGDVFVHIARRMLDVDVYDFQCGAKALTAATWEKVRPHIHEAGFGWDVELIAIAAAFGCDIEEVPVTWRDRPESSVPPLRTAVELGRVLVSMRARTRRLTPSPTGEPGERSSGVRSNGTGK